MLDKETRSTIGVGSKIVLRAIAIYLFVVLMFGFLYSQNLNDLTKESSFEVIDPYYFSVVTMTSLGFGEITPKTIKTKALVMLQAIFGLVAIGAFFTWLSLRVSAENQKLALKYQALLAEETKRQNLERAHLEDRYRDRLQYPSFVKAIDLLNKYIDEQASDHKRQAQQYDWRYYHFGDERIGVPPSYIDNNFWMCLGPEGQGDVKADRSDRWAGEMRSFSVKLHSQVLGAEPKNY